MENLYRQIIANSFMIWLCLLTAFTIFGQAKTEKKYEEYQNQQRALNLSFYKNDIKSLEDAPMRCFVRRQIIEFIYNKKIKSHFDLAESLAIDCLEDLKNNPKQKSGVNDGIAGRIISVLRANSPETAQLVEKKYAGKSDSFTADFLDIGSKEAATRLVDKFAKQLQRGEKPENVEFLLFRMKRFHPELSIILLDSILRFYEKLPIDENFDRNFTTVGLQFQDKSIPIGIRTRYYMFVLKIGQSSILADINSGLFRTGLSLMKWSLPAFKEDLPESYQQATAIYNTLESRYAEANKEELEILKRIENSENKLEQTIIEAKAAVDKQTKARMWKQAASFAKREKQYRIAIDSIIKYELPNNKRYSENYRFQFLTRQILPAVLKEKDFELAKYIIETIQDPNKKASVLLTIASFHSKSENEPKALEKLNEALRILNKSENDGHKVRHLLTASRLATKIENADAFEIANLAIKTINRLPTLNPEDQLETEGRNKYLSQILMPSAFNLDTTFKVLAEKDVDLAYSISQTIQKKDLRLVAEIVVEMFKVYPYTPKKEKETQN